MMCRDTQLIDYVENLEDLQVLFESMTPVIADFLDDAFMESYYTQLVTNMNWNVGKTLCVFGSHSQMTSNMTATMAIHGGVAPKAVDSQKIQNRQV
mmetsp:Transcript_36577/g.48017  ORF Transcript_36577/g.48017 Transcript_36577/m.48017 type:complete len:96 (+) Transcript_36577:1809-2096(+)